MRSTDNDILEYLLSDPDTPTATDLLAFAHYAQEKRIWLRAFKEERGNDATLTDTETWIRN